LSPHPHRRVKEISLKINKLAADWPGCCQRRLGLNAGFREHGIPNLNRFGKSALGTASGCRGMVGHLDIGTTRALLLETRTNSR
jgi:hypothetical protein